MDLTNDDVAEILALLDSLPYDELDVETPRFRLTLRRAPGGGWTEESRVLTEPETVTAPDAPAGPVSRAAQTVSGRDCSSTILASGADSPSSTAHSMSCGVP